MSSDSNPTTSGLAVAGLRKRLGGFQLAADFDVAQGERAALVGRSGSGKTTLFRILAGLEALSGREDAGRVSLDGVDITHLPPERRQIGVVFQEQALFPGLDVLENACFGLRMKGVSKDERRSQALPWLERVGLKSHLHAQVGKLSGGERQRVAFVRAILWKPRLLLLDEPFSALDPTLRGVLRRELVELHRLWPVPLLLVTHDQEDLDAIATSQIELTEESSTALRRFRKRRLTNSVFIE